MNNIAGIPDNNRKRIVIIGGGFAGLQLAKSLKKSDMQIVLIDRNNYHQFQPLFYQVATAGLEPSAISFPLRKIFQNQKHIHVRIASLEYIEADQKRIVTDTSSWRWGLTPTTLAMPISKSMPSPWSRSPKLFIWGILSWVTSRMRSTRPIL